MEGEKPFFFKATGSFTIVSLCTKLDHLHAHPSFFSLLYIDVPIWIL